jgi:hypothetical protein
MLYSTSITVLRVNIQEETSSRGLVADHGGTAARLTGCMAVLLGGEVS